MSEKDIAGILEGRLEMLRMTVTSRDELDAKGGEVWSAFAEAKVDRLSVQDRAEFQRHLVTTALNDLEGSPLGLFYSLLDGFTWQEATLFSQAKDS